MNILVTAIGTFTADIVIKTLQASHHRVTGCDIHPKAWIADAYNVDRFVQVPRAAEKEKYSVFIKDLCRQYDIQYIMPLIDAEIDIFCSITNELQDCGVCVCISEPDITRLCRDKYLLNLYLEQENICPVIPTCLFAEADESICRYPMVAKKRFGHSSEGLILIKNQNEFRYAREIIRDEEYILQPYIRGNILNADVVRDTSGNIVCIARQDLLRKGGMSISVEIIENPRLNETCAKLANLLKTTGASNFEFIETPEQLYLMEINPRFSGGIEFSHMAGYDVVSNHLRCFTGENIDKQISPKKMIISRKYEEYVTEVHDAE